MIPSPPFRSFLCRGAAFEANNACSFRAGLCAQRVLSASRGVGWRFAISCTSGVVHGVVGGEAPLFPSGGVGTRKLMKLPGAVRAPPARG